MKRKDVINFAPEGVKSRKRVPGYVLIIILVCIVLFTVSLFIILAKNDFNIGKALGAREADKSTSAVTTEAPVTVPAAVTQQTEAIEENVNFLILCADKKELTFCQVISVQPESRKISVKPIAPEFTLDFSEIKMQLKDAFGEYSIKELCDAFALKNIPIAKYIYVSEENFIRLMKKVGTTPINITGNYEFNVDAVKYTFRSGTQNLTSDMLLKYLKFAETGEFKLRLQANAVSDIIKTHFSEENFSKGESFFASLINNVDTDITAFDYNNNKNTIEKMIKDGTEITVIS